MLGFAPLAAAPLGATGAGGVAYDASFADMLAIADVGTSAQQTFAVAVDETASGAMSVAVAASTFNAVASAATTLADASSAFAAFAPKISQAATIAGTPTSLVTLLAQVTDFGVATDSVFVEASEFTATATDAADIVDSVQSTAVMAGFVSESAEIDDADSASYLWNLINTAQASSWGTINNAQSTSWTVVKTQN